MTSLLDQAVAYGRAFYQRQRLYSMLVLLPFALFALYEGMLAARGYLSRAELIVERDTSIPTPTIDLGLLSLGSNTTMLDALLIQDFILSRSMLDYLQGGDAKHPGLDLRKHYSSPVVDRIGRLSASASNEEFYRYYQKHVTVQVNQDSMIVNLTVSAFDPQFAHQVAQAIVERSERFVNEISQQIAQEQLAFVQGEIDRANAQLLKTSNDLIALQRENKIFSPEFETQSSARILGGLEAELSSQRTQLKALLAYLNEGAADVVAARKRIDALERQIEQERARQVGTKEEGLNDLALKYQSAQTAVKLAGDIYEAGLKTLEVTRLEASQKAKHLVQVSPPSLPDESEEPRLFRNLFAAFVFLNLGFFAVNLVVAVINDHRD